MDFFRWIYQCWRTSKILHLSVLYDTRWRLKVLPKVMADEDRWWERYLKKFVLSAYVDNGDDSILPVVPVRKSKLKTFSGLIIKVPLFKNYIYWISKKKIEFSFFGGCRDVKYFLQRFMDKIELYFKWKIRALKYHLAKEKPYRSANRN